MQFRSLLVHGGTAIPLWLRLVINATKRGVTGISGDLDVVTPLASCPWSGDERTSELSRAKTGQREVMGLVQTDTDVGVDGLSDGHSCTHMASRQIVRTYWQRQTDESERGNPWRGTQRWSIR